MKGIAVFGATGSVGRSALEVLGVHQERFRVVALTARRNVDLLAEQIQRFRPILAVIQEPENGKKLEELTAGTGTRIVCGEEGLIEAAILPEVDLILAAIVGAAGLRSTYHAITYGKDVALANKETLVVGGEFIMNAARQSGSRIVPVDSEHSAIHQCLASGSHGEVRRLILTASGGPFRDPRFDLKRVTPFEALIHPTWNMGRKITIDSATLMNKTLEVIEARWLFDIPAERIEIVVHPQSIVHSMVEFIDGSVIAQLGPTDMKIPIQYALSHPDRWDAPVKTLDLSWLKGLDFEEPNAKRFPGLNLGYRALEVGKTAPAALNAANEIAVESFLERKIRFTQIPEIIELVLKNHVAVEPDSLEVLAEVDRASREEAREHVSRLKF